MSQWKPDPQCGYHLNDESERFRDSIFTLYSRIMSYKNNCEYLIEGSATFEKVHSM